MDHRHIYTVSADRNIKVWDKKVRSAEKKCLRELQGHTNIVNCIVADESRLYSCSDDETINVWSPDVRKAIDAMQFEK